MCQPAPPVVIHESDGCQVGDAPAAPPIVVSWLNSVPKRTPTIEEAGAHAAWSYRLVEHIRVAQVKCNKPHPPPQAPPLPGSS